MQPSEAVEPYHGIALRSPTKVGVHFAGASAVERAIPAGAFAGMTIGLHNMPTRCLLSLIPAAFLQALTGIVPIASDTGLWSSGALASPSTTRTKWQQ
jgi:hypothetical protein